MNVRYALILIVALLIASKAHALIITYEQGIDMDIVISEPSELNTDTATWSFGNTTILGNIVDDAAYFRFASLTVEEEAVFTGSLALHLEAEQIDFFSHNTIGIPRVSFITDQDADQIRIVAGPGMNTNPALSNGTITIDANPELSNGNVIINEPIGIPEPSTISFLIIGLILLIMRGREKK